MLRSDKSDHADGGGSDHRAPDQVKTIKIKIMK
jgi:hypothetical protein